MVSVADFENPFKRLQKSAKQDKKHQETLQDISVHLERRGYAHVIEFGAVYVLDDRAGNTARIDSIFQVLDFIHNGQGE